MRCWNDKVSWIGFSSHSFCPGIFHAFGDQLRTQRIHLRVWNCHLTFCSAFCTVAKLRVPKTGSRLRPTCLLSPRLAFLPPPLHIWFLICAAEMWSEMLRGSLMDSTWSANRRSGAVTNALCRACGAGLLSARSSEGAETLLARTGPHTIRDLSPENTDMGKHSNQMLFYEL